MNRRRRIEWIVLLGAGVAGALVCGSLRSTRTGEDRGSGSRVESPGEPLRRRSAPAIAAGEVSPVVRREAAEGERVLPADSPISFEVPAGPGAIAAAPPASTQVRPVAVSEIADDVLRRLDLRLLEKERASAASAENGAHVASRANRSADSSGSGETRLRRPLGPERVIRGQARWDLGQEDHERIEGRARRDR